MRNFTISFLLFFLLIESQAQTGNWNPANANLSYPRTLLKAADTTTVQTALSTVQNYSLYNGIFTSINTSIPGGNTTTAERRARANFAKNTAFVILMNRQPSNGSLVPLDKTLRATFISNAKTLLENINPKVEVFATLTTTPYLEWQWRSKELIDYAIAYDLLRGAGISQATLAKGQSKLQDFAGYLYLKSITPFLTVVFYNQVKNNHNLMTAAALGLSAVVLNHVTSDSTYKHPINWINTGMYQIDNVLWRDDKRQSDSTAIYGYAEGPYYFKYAFLNCLPFIRSMGNFLPDGRLGYVHSGSSRSIRNPYHDAKYDLLYGWMNAIVMPDGRFPALEDSFIDMGMPELALTGKSRYVPAMHLKKLASVQLNSLTTQLRDVTVDMRAAYLAANITPTEPLNTNLTVLPKSGNLVFRSANDSLATYMHVYGKSGTAQTNSGGHSQADASSFIIHAKGQLLALDPGYIGFSRRTEVGNATNHNMLLVNGAGPAIGEPGAPNDALATIQNTFKTSGLSYGEVQTSYQSASITRKTIFVRNNYYILADFIKATDLLNKNFTWQLHGYGLEGGSLATGTFTDNLSSQEGTWHKNGVNLRAHVTATDGTATYSKGTNKHELIFDQTENHTTLLVEKSSVPETQFLSTLYPYTVSGNTVTTTTNPGTAALASTETAYKEVFWAKTDGNNTFVTDNSGTLPSAVGSDGYLTFYAYNTAESAFDQALLESGTLLKYGSTTIIKSTQRATISYKRNTDTDYEGYISRDAILTLALPSAPTSISGSTITDSKYNATDQTLAITFSGPSTFGITSQATTLPVTLVQLQAKRQAGRVQLTWMTASEFNNRGFAIRRRTEHETDFTEIGFIPGQGNSQQRNSYTFTDFTAPAGSCYYQLKQIDWDNAFEYSPIVGVTASLTKPKLATFPNPANGSVTVRFGHPGIEQVLQLSGPDGRLLQQQPFSQSFNLPTHTLVPGIYFLRITDKTGKLLSEVEKLVISR